MNEAIIINALLARLNECYTAIQGGLLSDNEFYNGRFDGLYMAINTAIEGTNYKLIFDNAENLYALIECHSLNEL